MKPPSPSQKKRNKPAVIRHASLQKKLRRIKLFLCDVDGVLTNGSVFMSGRDEMKQFHIQDGLGLRLLQQNGIKIGWISNRPSSVTLQRATELKVDFLSQDKSSKVETVTQLLARTKLTWEDVSFMGDDVVDLGVLRRAGVALVPANGIAEARDLADYVTKKAGGDGAVREVVEMILKAQNKWTRLIEEYSA